MIGLYDDTSYSWYNRLPNTLLNNAERSGNMICGTAVRRPSDASVRGMALLCGRLLTGELVVRRQSFSMRELRRKTDNAMEI